METAEEILPLGTELILQQILDNAYDPLYPFVEEFAKYDWNDFTTRNNELVAIFFNSF